MMKNYLFLLGAILLHILFCAESPLILKYSSAVYAVVIPFSYSIAGMVLSLVFIPILNIFIREGQEKKFLKGFTFKSLNMALYIGALVRFILFVRNF